MANPEHLEILKQGVDVWNQWREDDPDVEPDLSRASLSGENFRNADLSEVTLKGANLSGASFSRADLRNADLREVALDKANLSGANLMGADLRNANLNGAAFIGTHLDRTKLSGADVSGAIVSHTVFGECDLREVRGLESVEHFGPSIIGIETVYLSQGKISQAFLRGAGVPDNFIQNIHLFVGATFQSYSCFISYSSQDREFATRLHADLQNNGVRCWFSDHNIQAGKKLHEQIDTAIQVHERLLLVLSPNSIKSEWVKTEIARARQREVKEGERVLFPIRLNISFAELENWEYFDGDRGKDSAREIREYHIPDFTCWKDYDQYQQEFKKLLRDLKREIAITAITPSSKE